MSNVLGSDLIVHDVFKAAVSDVETLRSNLRSVYMDLDDCEDGVPLVALEHLLEQANRVVERLIFLKELREHNDYLESPIDEEDEDLDEDEDSCPRGWCGCMCDKCKGDCDE